MTEAWRGSEMLVVGIDIGTTQSAVSIVHLVPGQPSKVRMVSRWPGSPNSSKIPTVILYDDKGQPKSFGAEAAEESVQLEAEDEGWEEARWFKLHLHPQAMGPPPYSASASKDTTAQAAPDCDKFEIPPLPSSVTVQKCYSDFLAYLFRGTERWFKQNAPDGDLIWNKLRSTLTVVLAHPNGWSLHEQDVLKRAVVDADIMRTDACPTRLVFVTEAEASVHFGLAYSASHQSQWLSYASSFAVVDAGGSTVDICVYSVDSMSPKLKLKEAKTSECIQAGAIFVTRASEQLIKKKLASSKFNTPEYVKSMVDQFDSKTKVLFTSPEDDSIIKFGYDRDTDREVGIVRGRLTLSGKEVTEAFESCVMSIVKALRAQLEGTPVSHILLVGGFGESPYLQRRLREEFDIAGRKVVTVDEPSKKAVAEGASLFFCKDAVVARCTRLEFGIPSMRPFHQHEHEAGNRPILTTPRGSRYIRGGWSSIVKRGEVIDSDRMFRRAFYADFYQTDSLTYSMSVFTYSGQDGTTDYNGWSTDSNDEHPGFELACVVTADLTPLASTEKLQLNPTSGRYFWDLAFEIGIYFGGTSLKACMIWKEPNGQERRGPAAVVPSAYL